MHVLYIVGKVPYGDLLPLSANVFLHICSVH